MQRQRNSTTCKVLSERKLMEFLAIFTSLCICLSIFLTPCVGFQLQEQPSHDEQAIRVDGVHYSLIPTLPRKLRVLLDEAALPVKGLGVQVSTSNKKQKGAISGKAYDKEENVTNAASRGTRQAWVEEGTDTSQFFTMDYSRVRRRRPIHNKSMPVGP